MNADSTSIPAIREKLREFDRVATTLRMPRRERLAILNTTEQLYTALQAGQAAASVVAPELERRLSYAMPLMRRLASNTVGMPSATVVDDRRSAA